MLKHDPQVSAVPFSCGRSDNFSHRQLSNFAAATATSLVYASFVLAAAEAASPPPRELLNLSTRADVQNGEAVMIGGLIMTGEEPKEILLRAIGPSLTADHVAAPLPDPVLELHLEDGTVIVNDDWRTTQEADIEATQMAPKNDKESAILISLPPGAHTLIVRSKDASAGPALVELYDLQPSSSSQILNLSTRALVGNDDRVLIGGFMVGGAAQSRYIVVRGLGPSLSESGIADPLGNPALHLYDQNGTLIGFNGDWQDDVATAYWLGSMGLGLHSPQEAAVYVQVVPGAYTVVMYNEGGPPGGVGLLEIYDPQ